MKKGYVRFFALSIVILFAFGISEAADTALEKTFQKNLEDNHSVVKKAKEKQQSVGEQQNIGEESQKDIRRVEVVKCVDLNPEAVLKGPCSECI